MSRNETTGAGTVSFGRDAEAAMPASTPRRAGWFSRHLPLPIMVGGMVATIAWMGLVGWWFFTFVRWSIG